MSAPGASQTSSPTAAADSPETQLDNQSPGKRKELSGNRLPKRDEQDRMFSDNSTDSGRCGSTIRKLDRLRASDRPNGERRGRSAYRTAIGP